MGYYENIDVLQRGLRAPTLIENPALLDGRAVKVALQGLVSRRIKEELNTLQQPDVVLLLPIRSPAESIGSQKVFLHTPEKLAKLSLDFIGSVRERLIDYGFLAHWVTGPDFLRAAPICIDYHQAINNPAAYVDRIAVSAGLKPTEDQRVKAVANIDAKLYRYRILGAKPDAPQLKKIDVLERAYEILRTDAPDKWLRLQAQLPRWVTDDVSARPLVSHTEATG